MSMVSPRVLQVFHKLQRNRIVVNFEIQAHCFKKQNVHENVKLEQLLFRKQLKLWSTYF